MTEQPHSMGGRMNDILKKQKEKQTMEEVSKHLQNQDLEAKVLGACMVDESYMRLALASGLNAATFTLPQNALIFTTLYDILEHNVPISLESMVIRLPNLQAYLVSLFDASPTNVLFNDWIICLRQLEAARRASEGVGKFLAQVKERPFASMEHGEVLRRIAEDYTASVQTRGVRDAREVGASWLAEIQDDTKQVNIPLLKGANLTFKHGWLFVVGADTGAGKTAFSAGAVNCMIDAGYTVLYVCSETRAEDIYGRVVAARCGVEEFRFREKTANQSEWQALAKAHAEVQGRSSQLFYHCLGDDLDMKPSSIIATCDNAIRKNGRLDVIVLDFLQGLSADTEKRNDTQTLMIKRILEVLEKYATRKQIALLVISQYSREARKLLKEGEVPQKEWLRDSGAIEELAFVVAHLVRIGEGKDEKIYLWCPKNSKHRNCRPFKHELRWTGSTYELAPSSNANDNDVPEF